MGEMIGGRYRLESRLGAGGMAEVWVAYDTQLDRTVAVKLLGARADPMRFEREAHAVAALSHPNISRLFDYGSEGGRPYMVFEHLPGGTLEDRFVPGQALADETAARIASELASGLAHRDLKPANVLFDEEGRAKIADFGIARGSGADTLTEDGTMLGTAAYMSPEQAAGRPVTPASDVYAFGVLLYRMLSGRLPFESPEALQVARQHLQEAPPPLSALRPDAPPVIAALAGDALAKDPAARPPDGAALVDRLSGRAAGTLGGAASAVTQVIRRRPSRRLPVPIAALLALPVLVAAGVGLALFAGSGGSNPKPSPSSVAPPPPASPTQTATAPTRPPPPPPPPSPPPPPPPPPPLPPPPPPPAPPPAAPPPP